MSTTSKEMEKAVTIFNVMNDRDLIPAEGFSFLNCLEMAKKSTRLLPETTELEASMHDTLLDAVVRAVNLSKDVNLLYRGAEIHISTKMTPNEAFEHAKYVVALQEAADKRDNKPFPADQHKYGQMPPLPIPDDQQFGRGLRLSKNRAEELTLDYAFVGAPGQIDPFPSKIAGMKTFPVPDEDQAVRDAAFEALEAQNKVSIPDEAFPVATLPEFEPLTHGFIYTPDRGETISQTIRRLMEKGVVRARICGVVMTIRDDITDEQMIAEAHRRIKLGISDTPMGADKELEFEEEMLPDGTLRTARRTWRRGYKYRLDVLPNDRTQMAEYHIHLKERPTQTWIAPHLQLHYDREARVFLNLTNGIDRFENVAHLYFTANGRAVRDVELAKLEKIMAEEFAAKDKPYYKPSRKVSTVKVSEPTSIPEPPAEPAGNTIDWEDPDMRYRVRYYDDATKGWKYSYFASKPNAMMVRLRNSKEGGPATVETQKN